MPVTALDVHSRSLVLDGRPFGAAGAYEKLAGTLHFAVDPGASAARRDHGSRAGAARERGRVEFQSDFYLLRPVDPSRGNRRLLLDIPNRGRKVALGMFNSAVRVPDPTAAEDFGNGFLMRHGWTVAWVGWQHDVPRRDGMMALDSPARPGRRAASCAASSGRTRRVDVLPMADRYHIPHAAAELDDPAARAARARARRRRAAVTVPRSAWRFARREHIESPLDGGFEPGPDLRRRLPLAGSRRSSGWASLAVRDTALPALGRRAARGTRARARSTAPTSSASRRAGASCATCSISGLNEDEAGRLVFDAVIPHVAGARRGEFNHALRPAVASTRSDAVGSLFPFTDDEQDDPVTGQRDGAAAGSAARRRAEDLHDQHRRRSTGAATAR